MKHHKRGEREEGEKMERDRRKERVRKRKGSES